MRRIGGGGGKTTDSSYSKGTYLSSLLEGWPRLEKGGGGGGPEGGDSGGCLNGERGQREGMLLGICDPWKICNPARAESSEGVKREA